MLKRAIALSLALVVGLGVLLPFATNEAEAGGKHTKKRKYRKHYKKYSKRWWRQYRARMKRKRSQQARVRALRLRQLRLAEARKAETANAENGDAAAQPVAVTAPTPTRSKGRTSKAVQPAKGWNETQSSDSELRFRIDDSAGSQVGSASISVVGPSAFNSPSAGRGNSLGGVPTSSLRRDVINKMIQENGWVVNDYQKEIGGRPVYVVVAQSQAKNGLVQSRMFYFTEVDGRIYNVATNSPADQSNRLEEESEKVLSSLPNRLQPVLRASTKE